MAKECEQARSDILEISNPVRRPVSGCFVETFPAAGVLTAAKAQALQNIVLCDFHIREITPSDNSPDDMSFDGRQLDDRKVKVFDCLDHIDELVKVNGLGDVRVGIQAIGIQHVLLIL